LNGSQDDRPRSPRELSGQRRAAAPSDTLCGVTDVGLVRANNEDGFFLGCRGGLLAVADGLGGQPAGEVASREALAAIAAQEARAGELLAMGSEASDAAARSLLFAMFDAAEQRLLEIAGRDPGCRGMATTLVVTIVGAQCAWTTHVGDVRAYLGSGDALVQITRDDSMVADLVDAGQLDAEDARTDPRRHVVTQALGLGLAIQPSFQATPTQPGDTLLLCSDGLWEAIEARELARILASRGSVETRALELVDRALAAGGLDNATAVLCQLRSA
jgi:serine/threonine protein phosphatase PrpC